MTLRMQLVFAVIYGLLLTAQPATAQTGAVPKASPSGLGAKVSQSLLDSVLDCTMREGDTPWVPKNLRRDGLLRFTYVHELPKKVPGEYDYRGKFDSIYVAFWNDDRTKGEFLDFSVDHIDTRRWLTISNDGQIFYTRGKLDLDFFQGGEWMRTHYMIRLEKLRAAPVETVTVRDIKRTSTVCDSLRHDSKTGYDPPAKK
jgi:hypothetical protein